MTITLEDVTNSKNIVDKNIEDIVDRLKTKKQGLDKLTFLTVFDFFTGEEIDDIMSKDEGLRKMYKKAMDSQGSLIDVMEKYMEGKKEK